MSNCFPCDDVCVCVFFVLFWFFFLSLFSTKRCIIKLLDSVLVMPEIREPWLFLISQSTKKSSNWVFRNWIISYFITCKLFLFLHQRWPENILFYFFIMFFFSRETDQLTFETHRTKMLARLTVFIIAVHLTFITWSHTNEDINLYWS